MSITYSGNNLQRLSNNMQGTKQLSKTDTSPNETLFRTLLSDPNKRALVLQLLSTETSQVAPLVTASSQELSQSYSLLKSTTQVVNTTFTTSAVYKDSILKGVVAYVELRNKEGFDRSAGAKVLMQSLGATVKDTFTNDVTHVIFKDGSFETYLKAKRDKVHLVSVLWLEAVRNSNVRVAEEDYPALGTASYDLNIAAMCEDYEEVVRDELRLANRSITETNNTQKTALSPELRSINSSSITTPESFSERLIPTSPEGDGKSINSFDSVRLPSEKGNDELDSDRLSVSTPELTSDDDSDCGIINGLSVGRRKNLNDINLNHESHKEQQVTVRGSTNESSSQSISLLSTKSKKTRTTKITDTDLENKENTNHLQVQPQKLKNNPTTKGKGKKVTQSESLTPNNKLVKNRTKVVSLRGQLKASSDSALGEKHSGTNCGHSETIPSLKISADGSKDSSKRRSQSGSTVSLQISKDSLNENLLICPTEATQNSLNDEFQNKKRTKEANINDLKRFKVVPQSEDISLLKHNTSNTTKRTSKSESMPSLHVSTDSSFQGPIKAPNINFRNTLNSDADLNGSLINRISRMAIRGSSMTDNSNMGRLVIEAVSPVSTSSRYSFRSCSSSSFRNGVIQDNIGAEDKEKEDNLLKANDKNVKRINVICETIIKPTETENNKVPKQNIRKLYNPDQTIDETHKMWVDEENKKAITIRNQQPVPFVPIAPLLFTPKAKRFLKFLGKNKKTHLNDKTISPNKSGINIVKGKGKKVKKKKTVKVKVDVNKGALDEEKDEQTELAAEIVNKERRKSLRLLESQKSKLSQDNQLNRRSTLDFVTRPKAKNYTIFSQNQRKIKPTIVCTRFHKPDVLLFTQIVKKLGTFNVEDEVSKKTTHLVVGEPKRTINLLRALARGCWIVNQEWLLRSLEAGNWLPEEDFELTEFSPAVQRCRLQRQAFGSSFSMDIFENCGSIYIARNSTPRRSDLQELVELCKGTLTCNACEAAIVVGEWVQYDAVCVTEQWILDSVTSYKRKSFKKYLIK